MASFFCSVLSRAARRNKTRKEPPKGGSFHKTNHFVSQTSYKLLNARKVQCYQ